MNMKKNIVLFLMMLIVCCSLFAACSNKSGTTEDLKNDSVSETEEDTDKVYKVGFVNQTDADDCCFSATSRFRAFIESDEFKEQVENKKVEVFTTDSALDIAKQTDNVETLLTKNVDAIFIIGVDTAGNSTAVKACNEAGVPVYMVGTEASEGDYKFIGFKEYDIGYSQAKYVSENFDDGTKLCYLTGTAGREAAVDQEEGFRDGLKESGRDDVEILSVQSGEWTAEESMRVTEDWIQTYGNEVDLIVSMDGKMASGAVEALKAANMIDDVRVIGVMSLGKWNSDLIKDGYMEFAVYKDWPSIGDLCGQIFADQINGENIPDETFFDMKDITLENFDEFNFE